MIICQCCLFSCPALFNKKHMYKCKCQRDLSWFTLSDQYHIYYVIIILLNNILDAFSSSLYTFPPNSTRYSVYVQHECVMTEELGQWSLSGIFKSYWNIIFYALRLSYSLNHTTAGCFSFTYKIEQLLELNISLTIIVYHFAHVKDIVIDSILLPTSWY